MHLQYDFKSSRNDNDSYQHYLLDNRAASNKDYRNIAAFAPTRSYSYTNLFYMTQEELGLNEEDFLDGINPSDLGMKHYAAAYAKKLAYILISFF